VAQPDIYVKGGDYTLDTLNQEERRIVEQAGGRIVLIPFVPGKSTTALLKRIATP
jgi:bifunctional ADP-heptose synthase (sugar kinase/adenylyltransferase)